ncbi:hypothetical protein GLOIN_2v1814156 [Rhizophagus irregularis DAOM 181602=DAOM 197198]|nr:hypothetical protein GLOIN_2v1814156 [Rhizophagus irregularis DAOM 181602=DAOM 197198]
MWNAITSGVLYATSLYNSSKSDYYVDSVLHLQYKPDIHQKLIGTNSKKSSESHVFTTNSAEEVLYSLSHKYCMNRTEIQRLRAYYVTALNRNANQLSLITNSIQKYGKLQTKNELIINSKLSSRKGDVTRTNYCISVKLLVDQNAHRPNAPVILEEREFFGEVQYFFSHQYNSHRSMLAYVQWVRNPQPSGHGPLKFRDNSAFEVINVSAICRNVGFLKMSFISLIEKIKLNFDDFYIFLFNQIDTDADLQNRNRTKYPINLYLVIHIYCILLVFRFYW